MTEKNYKNNQENHSKPSSNEFETTGHNWDGISKYNIPAPRWWLIVWIICIIWAFIYWFFYPTWPTKSGNSKGSLNWSKFYELEQQQKIIDDKKQVFVNEINSKSLDEIKNNDKLFQFALNTGKSAFQENCSACHGQGGAGGIGYPNLNDDDWLWGGKLTDIYQTLLYGIRSGHENARINQMPSFGLDKILKRNEIKDTIEYVLSLSNKAQYNTNGDAIFKANCTSCHGNDAKGNQQLGAPNLTDAIWLYGSKKEELFYTIYYARAGVMPFWSNRLPEYKIKSLALYVHSFGGGK